MKPRKCSNCGSDNLKWYISTHVNDNSVQDGRLKLNEVQVIAYLACEECSETLKIIHEDEINKRLNSHIIEVIDEEVAKQP